MLFRLLGVVWLYIRYAPPPAFAGVCLSPLLQCTASDVSVAAYSVLLNTFGRQTSRVHMRKSGDSPSLLKHL